MTDFDELIEELKRKRDELERKMDDFSGALNRSRG